MRIKYQGRSESHLFAETVDGRPVTLKCNAAQQQELASLESLISPSAIFNLLNVKQIAPGEWETEFLVLEPDYLIDISTLAECFRPYGHHPLNYLFSRMQPIENTQYILLGNTANFFIDELLNDTPENPTDYASAVKKLFKSSPLSFAACNDINEHAAEIRFFDACKKHFYNIRDVISGSFLRAGIDKTKIVVEPSFVSNALGLQGRLDLMASDFSAFVELKSGKAVEDYRTGGQFVHAAINHYVQMILYLAVLEFNLHRDADGIRSYLLYSKYPILSKERHSRQQLQEAIRLRNAIVALEFDTQHHNDTHHTGELLNSIRPEILNTAQLTNDFFNCYLRPPIERFQHTLQALSNRERAYFLRLYTFIAKELWLSKAGEREYEGVNKSCNLWNASFEDKMLTGEILYDLRIEAIPSDAETTAVTLKIPEYDELYLPNFRTGDAVVLYERNSEADSVNNKQVFKGAIESFTGNQIKIRLRFRQQNAAVLNPQTNYALEHDYMDTSYTGMFKALMTFAEANPDRRDLLLCRRLPLSNELPSINPEERDVAVRSVNKAMAARDCFLLVGPPGTGKTSLVLRRIVETGLRNNDRANLLLLSYTNRAVDEICNTLSAIDSGMPFIRIGSELNCDPEYRDYLLDRQLASCNRRSEVQAVIHACRIFVGTVASIWNKPEIFKLKRFDMAIVDEAGQLLEPHLLGVLCAKTGDGRNAVDRFVLIGDHKQLPAIVLQSAEESKVTDPILNEMGLLNLNSSLFERLYQTYTRENCDHAFDLLTRQGRMHPTIAAFPSRYFYENKLECAGLPHQTEQAETIARLTFYPATKSTADRSGKVNPEEAKIVVRICNELLERYAMEKKTFDPHDVGIITPYRNQIALIRKLLQESGHPALAAIVVDTIERFQGSQRDVIIYSFCVNSLRQLESLPCLMEENGMLIDRKLNVVLTRARKQLFITGNPRLLAQNQLFNRLLQHIRQSPH
ncbi:MAG: AAA family ATPase [Dysgonamonadaceae bacterium]|nr:AAA family ATPase [Dysgonamonadaceae bacterium]